MAPTEYVFPASAGMNRRRAVGSKREVSIPRIRGDEPQMEWAGKKRDVYSPHPRG